MSFNFILIFKNKHLVSSLYRAQQIFLFTFFFVMTGEKNRKKIFFLQRSLLLQNITLNALLAVSQGNHEQAVTFALVFIIAYHNVSWFTLAFIVRYKVITSGAFWVTLCWTIWAFIDVYKTQHWFRSMCPYWHD